MSPTNAKCSINDLPEEVLVMILKRLALSTSDFVQGKRLGPTLQFAECYSLSKESIVHYPSITTTYFRDSCSYLYISRRFRRIYEPLLYQFPHLGPEGWDIPFKTSRFLTTLTLRPDLCASISHLEVTPQPPTPANTHNVTVVVAILRRCKPSLRSAFIHTNYHDRPFARTLFEALANNNLHTLSILATKNDSCSALLFFRYLPSPSLRTLHLCRYTRIDFNDPESYPDTVGPNAKKYPLRDEFRSCKGTSAITNLVLNEGGDYPWITSGLIAWPARLVELELTGVPECRRKPFLIHHTANEVQDMLEPHRESLEVLRLGIMKVPFSSPTDTPRSMEEKIPDFTNFPKLKRLMLPEQSLFHGDPATVAGRVVHAPWLQRLEVVSYLIRPYDRGATGGFTLWHKMWLVKFGEAVAATRGGFPPPDAPAYQWLTPSLPPPSSSSSSSSSSSDSDASPSPTSPTVNPPSLSLDFHFHFHPSSPTDIKEHFLSPFTSAPDSEFLPSSRMPWPWLYVKDAASALRLVGVRLLFEPSISEGEWSDLVDRVG